MRTILAVWGAVWIVMLWLAAIFRGHGREMIPNIRRALRRSPETTAILVCLAVAILGGSSVYKWHTGIWPSMVQFMLGGWPEDYYQTLSQFQIGLGVVLQIVFTFGLPVLLVTIVYQRLTRRLEMRIIDFIHERDEVAATQIYLTYRTAMRSLAERRTLEDATVEGGTEQTIMPSFEEIDQLCWALANRAVSRVQNRFDELLPEDTLGSLNENRVDVGLEGFAVTRGD